MMQNRIFAVTGGIGSGKSTVCNFIKDKGYPVISADEVYRELIKNWDFVKEIYDALQIEYEEGEGFNNKKIAEVVFSNPEKLRILNSITHPRIVDEMFNRSKNYEVCFHEVPLLFESSLSEKYEKIIVVSRDESLRIESVMKRSNLSREEVEKRIKNQIDYNSYAFDDCIIVENNGTKDDLFLSVSNLFASLGIEKKEEEIKKGQSVSKWPLVLSICGLIVSMFFGSGIVLNIISLIGSLRIKNPKSTIKTWSKTISIIGIVLGALFLLSSLIYIAVKGTKIITDPVVPPTPTDPVEPGTQY